MVVRLSLANKCHNIAAPFKALLSLVDRIDLLTMFIRYLFLSRFYSHFELSHGGQVSASKYRRLECLFNYNNSRARQYKKKVRVEYTA